MLKAVLIEAFSEGPCCGNGAAVVLLEQPWQDAWLQAIAGSLRQSETAFLLRRGEHWLLRWFTPSCEVRLCGHATLAALLALRHWQLVASDGALLLHSRSGPLQVCPHPDKPWSGSIDLPGDDLVAEEPAANLVHLLAEHGLGTPLGHWRSGLGYQVVLLDATAPLEACAGIAAQLEGTARQGLVLMQPQPEQACRTPRAFANQPVDYRLRFFAPGLGIPEDPVTGSAHALVAPWWQARLGRARVVGWQCSDRPGGVVCEAGPSGTIRLSGSGHLLWDGTLNAPPLVDPAAPPPDDSGWRSLLPGS